MGDYVKKKPSTLSRIYRYIKDRPGCTGHDITCGLKLDNAIVHAGLRQLESIQGKIESEKKLAAWYHRGGHATHAVKHYYDLACKVEAPSVFGAMSTQLNLHRSAE